MDLIAELERLARAQSCGQIETDEAWKTVLRLLSAAKQEQAGPHNEATEYVVSVDSSANGHCFLLGARRGG